MVRMLAHCLATRNDIQSALYRSPATGDEPLHQEEVVHYSIWVVRLEDAHTRIDTEREREKDREVTLLEARKANPSRNYGKCIRS